ncbi:hypothetical protein AURDEDRAFT_162227 [Auricularia subglabra TFB-10046 SS5]|nr:hypothetical protein AURDEDRAFT_162227 [Auricularia subglabra TFB-10046 SS5]
MASSVPTIPITLNKTAFLKSSAANQGLALNAQRHITDGRADLALEYLNKLLEDKRVEANPLIIEGYMMLARIALDQGRFAEACADLQLVAEPSTLISGNNTRGTYEDNLAKYNATRTIIRCLQQLLSKPRMLSAPVRYFGPEVEFSFCHADSLRTWAIGQHLLLPPETDWLGWEALRGVLKEAFSTPAGNYIVIPPHGNPFLSTPVAAPVCLLKPSTRLHTQSLYNDDRLEYAMGNLRGWPEGHMFRIYEAIMHNQSEAQGANLARNRLAETLLHCEGEIYGMVLVQMCYLLKHRETRRSLIAARMPLSLEFLRGAEWKQMRMEYRAFNLAGGKDITLEQIALIDADAARFHVHLAV